MGEWVTDWAGGGVGGWLVAEGDSIELCANYLSKSGLAAHLLQVEDTPWAAT